LADASVNVVAYACLVAVMAEGPGAHRDAETNLSDIFAAAGCPVPVVTSAGALVDTLHELGVHRIAVVAPYVQALTHRVCDYIVADGVSIEEARSLSVTDNTVVGRLDPENLLRVAAELPRNVDAVVLSACVQMPTVFVLLAPPNSEGVSRLNRTKIRLPAKNYGTALGDLQSFYAMATPGTLSPELDSVEGFKLLTGAFIRITVAPETFNSPMVRAGTHQGLLLEGPHRELFNAASPARLFAKGI
jgi:hypothetical protein